MSRIYDSCATLTVQNRENKPNNNIFLFESAEDYIYEITHRVMAIVALYIPIDMIKSYIL